MAIKRTKLAVAASLLVLAFTGAVFAAGRIASTGAPHVTAAQLATQRKIELFYASAARAQTAQCFANHVPDSKCTVLRMAPIGSSTVSCGSGGCFEADGTNAPVDTVTPGESCTTSSGHAGVWEATDSANALYACELPGPN